MPFQLLGPLGVTADGREAAVLRPSKPTVLLAALLLHANSVVSVGCLLRAVWGEEQPATPKAALQTCVLRLRRLFARHGVTDTLIEAVPGGYRITASARTLDLLAFRQRARTANGLADEGDSEAELYALKDALALWQGSLLANVPSPLLHRDEVPRLIEERLRAVERARTLELSLGHCGEALAELWNVTREHPGHERFREQLIEALYRTGRQTEALAEYRCIKAHLREELGVDPSPALRRLELAILRGEELGPPSARGAAVAAGAAGAAARPAVRPAGLPLRPLAPASAASLASVVSGGPCTSGGLVTAGASAVSPVADVPSFAGRTAEVTAMAAQLIKSTRDGSGDPSPVLVTGAPGIGKTALARHVAHLVRGHFPGGALLVRMVRPDGTPRNSAEVAQEVAAALRQRGGGQALLVLDDVVDAEQVRPSLSLGRRGDAAVVTSRRGLAGLVLTHGGRVHRLGTLERGESRRLLLAALGAERVEAAPDAARQLAETCGHHPLALRITAAWLLTRPALRLADAADWLAQDPLPRLALTDDSALSVLRVCGLALDRLDPRLAAAFLRAGALGPAGSAGAFRAEDAAGQLGMTVAEAEEVLDQLADAGLLEDGPPGPYGMHPLLRAYAGFVTEGARARQDV